MPAAARTGDIFVGVCCLDHHDDCESITGVISTGSANHFSGGLPSARLTDTCVADCGNIGLIVTGSPNRFCNNLASAFVGSTIIGPDLTGVVVSGNPTHIIN